MGRILLAFATPLVFAALLLFLAPRILRRYTSKGRRTTPP